MTNTNTNNLSAISFHFPPLHPEPTRNPSFLSSTQTCKNFFLNSKILKSKSIKNLNDFSQDKLLLNPVTSSSKSIHLLSALSVNKNISFLKEDNIRHKSFLQLYTNSLKPKPHHHPPFDISVHNPTKNSTAQCSCMSTTISMKPKHKKTLSSNFPHNKKDESDTLSSANCFDGQYGTQCKEFDMIFANSIKQMQRIRKRKRSVRQFLKNKYTNNSVNEINETQNKLSYLSGIINYIYPKVVLLKTTENKKKGMRNVEKSNLSSVQTCQSYVESYGDMVVRKKKKSRIKEKLLDSKEFDLNFFPVKRSNFVLK